MSKRLVIVSHAPSPNTRELTEAVMKGASNGDFKDVDVRCIAPLQCSIDDVMAAHAVILGTTENFGYMSGALKDFFDRIYYPCLEKTQGMPYALFIRAGNDGTGALDSIQRIVAGLRWRLVQEPFICRGEFRPECVARGEELGLGMSAGLAMGVF